MIKEKDMLKTGSDLPVLLNLILAHLLKIKLIRIDSIITPNQTLKSKLCSTIGTGVCNPLPFKKNAPNSKDCFGGGRKARNIAKFQNIICNNSGIFLKIST
jgi:hypothetical protein